MSASQSLLQAGLFLSLLRRRLLGGLTSSARIKLVLLSAVLLLFVWMQVGTLRKDDATTRHVSRAEQLVHQPPKEIPMKGRAKEYPDFDYKYDLRKEKRTFGADATANRQDGEDDFLAGVRHKVESAKPFGRKVDADDLRLLFPANATGPSETLQKQPRPGKKGPPYSVHQRRRPNTLNGQRVSDNHGDFDVVGGTDLYQGHQQSLDAGFDEFAADEAKVVPGLGENGDPVNLDDPAEQEEAKQVMQKEAFNLVVSDKISLRRKVPDTRDPLCQSEHYDADLPSTSVIIIFTNEAWTPLLRTIWSVLDKTPERNLKEIILVDDFSDKKHLGGKLERYIQKKFPSKVRLKRLPKRSGLIRARLTGARLATGDVLVFLDSHCECGTQWLEPLLQRIKDDRRVFAIPIIDVIDDKTLEYYHGNGVYFQIGGFTWAGHFNWIDIPEHENERRGSPIGPTRTPTMAGGLFAVERDFFWEIGSYDEEMDVWGGENLEMSFRVWQCGGILENIPCSRVGHIFRSFHPYSFPGNKDTHGINTARTVEVWMEDYKRLFYMNRPDLLQSDIGDVKNRMKFKEERQCKSFKWYLDNIFPQKFILDDPDHVFAYGRVRNPQQNVCLDTLQNDEKDSYELGRYPCHNYVAASQFFSFSQSYELRREDACAEVSLFNGGEERVRMVPCHRLGEDQEWMHTKEGRLIHKATNKCLAVGAADGDNANGLVATACKADKSQIWYFDHYIN